MTKRTLFKQALGLAIQTAVFVTIAASAATASAAETASDQKIGRAVSAPSQAQAATSAADKPLWERKTDSAYLTAFAYHCAPAMFDLLAGAVTPNGIEVAIYTDRLRVEYAGDCRAFYLNEVAARIDLPGQQALRNAQRP